MRTPSDNYLFAGVVGSGGLTTRRSVLAIASTAVVVGRTVGVLVVVATIAVVADDVRDLRDERTPTWIGEDKEMKGTYVLE